jgi:hypothetical protein
LTDSTELEATEKAAFLIEFDATVIWLCPAAVNAPIAYRTALMLAEELLADVNAPIAYRSALADTVDEAETLKDASITFEAGWSKIPVSKMPVSKIPATAYSSACSWAGSSSHTCRHTPSIS